MNMFLLNIFNNSVACFTQASFLIRVQILCARVTYLHPLTKVIRYMASIL